MKTLILLILTALSLSAYSQCTKCSSITEALIKPEGVKHLKINGFVHDIHLDSFPLEILRLRNLEVLYLSTQNIKSIPKEIASFKSLKILSFADCKLESLPEEIFTMTNLEELILLDNAFSEKYIIHLREKFGKLLPRTKLFL